MPIDNSGPPDWKPTGRMELLRARANLCASIRAFLNGRGILEVETPILSRAANPDVNLHSLRTRLQLPDRPGRIDAWFNTSPEFAMKRLLAAGSGPIWQITKVFRDAELGSRHQPEFTMLEWYRPGFDHLQLMHEVAEMLSELGIAVPGRASYAEVFGRRLDLDPHAAEDAQLLASARQLGLHGGEPDRRELLDFLFDRAVVPHLGKDGIGFVYDFPICQAALSRVRNDNPPVAERFELFLSGMEIANGFHELADAAEQRGRFEADNRRRRARGLEDAPIDERLLAALEAGIPDCAGVALGIDRLAMAHFGCVHIVDVIAFPLDRA